MYQGPPPTQSYNDFLMQQELHQRLNYGPNAGKERYLKIEIIIE